LAITPAPAIKIKAAYIFQFTKFIEWPDNNIKSKKSFTICILGSEPILSQLQPLNKLNIIIKSLKEKDTLVGCEILYIGKSAEKKVNKIIKLIRYHPILTVSSIPNFVNTGGMINFVIADNKVRIEINLNSIRDADLNISAKLLEISLNVNQHSSRDDDL
jgi:hypothetical protein